jgi:Ca-activated chloride channel homolog
VLVEVRGGTAERVELHFNGRLAGASDAAPHRFRVDTGLDNIERRFRARAVGTDGQSAEAELVVPAIRVDLAIEARLQQLYLTATSGDQAVLDLGPEELRIVDQRRRQQIVTFERGDVPLAAALVLDASLSMRGEPLAIALSGARRFAEGLAPLDLAALLLFSDRIVHRSEFTGDAERLLAGLTGAEARGGTALNDHLYLALQLLERQQGRRVVILLSDGVDVDSVLSAAEVREGFGRSQALLYWIQLQPELAVAEHRSVWRDPATHRAEIEGLLGTVALSGGRVLPVSRVEDVVEAFGAVLEELREQYVLGYYPDGLRHDGRWRRVRVETHRKGVRLRVREGYFDH